MTALGWQPEVDGAPSWFPDIRFPSPSAAYLAVGAYLTVCALFGAAVGVATARLFGRK